MMGSFHIIIFRKIDETWFYPPLGPGDKVQDVPWNKLTLPRSILDWDLQFGCGFAGLGIQVGLGVLYMLIV